MTRASLLRILDHVNGISNDEIRELEQLAAAFPYCQTAHVLLAKTAHDRGSMLAGQRLRRAATYAADRELLRQLLERPAAPATREDSAAPAAAAPTDVAHATTVTTAAATAAQEPVVAAASAPEADLFAVEVVSAPALADETTPTTQELVAAEAPILPATPSAQEPEAPSTFVTEATDAPATAETTPPESAPKAETPTTEASQPVETAPAGLPEMERPADAAPPAPAEEAAGVAEALPTASAPAELSEATTSNDEDAAKPADDEEVPAAPSTETAEATDATGTTEPADEMLPAVAPPIRPPSSAGISRFEFGLGESRLPEPTGYRLPGFDEDEQEPGADDDALPTFRPAAPPRITAPFRADAELGYALGGGSRLGYDLQARTPDGFTLDLPLEAFFEPDALLLAHARAHQPAPKASSLDLINRFLKAQPRIKAAGTNAALPAAEQADLSVRSSAAAPALASESLAKIMIRQGKTAKAIEIYERLMAKQPEKMAYFAEQIQQLQQPPE